RRCQEADRAGPRRSQGRQEEEVRRRHRVIRERAIEDQWSPPPLFIFLSFTLIGSLEHKTRLRLLCFALLVYHYWCSVCWRVRFLRPHAARAHIHQRCFLVCCWPRHVATKMIANRPACWHCRW